MSNTQRTRRGADGSDTRDFDKDDAVPQSGNGNHGGGGGIPKPGDVPLLTPEQIREMSTPVQSDIVDRLRERRTRTEVDRLAAAERKPRQLPVFASVREIPRTKLSYRVDKLWPVGAIVLLSAYFKVGKSTLLRNLIRSLLTGDDFLGFRVRAVSGAIVVADFEMPDSIALERLDAHGLGDEKRLHYEFLRGRGQDFDVTDDEWLNQLAGALRDLDCEVLFIDTLNALANALGINLDAPDGAGPLLASLEKLKLRAGIREMVITAQTGHGDHSRPAHSKDIGAGGDILWNLQRVTETNLDGPRKFFAHGRCEGTGGWLTLQFDRDTDTVTVDGNAPASGQASAISQVLNALTLSDEPVTVEEVRLATSLAQQTVSSSLRSLEATKVAERLVRKGNEAQLWKLRQA